MQTLQFPVNTNTAELKNKLCAAFSVDPAKTSILYVSINKRAKS